MSDIESPNDPIHARAVAASAELVDSFAALDVEADLASVRQGSVIPISGGTQSRTRRWFAAIAAAAVVVIIAGAVALVVTSDDPSTITDTPVTTAAPNPATVTSPTTLSTTPPAPATTSLPPATTAPPPSTTTTAVPQAAAVASVSYLDPPPELPMRQLATIEVPIQPDGGYSVAIGDLGIAVSSSLYSYAPQNPTDTDQSTIDVIGFDGSIRKTVDIEGGALLAYGPGDVVYITRQGTAIGEFAVYAIPLSGPNAGTEVRTELENINLFTEYPLMSFGHSADGVIHRRQYLAEEPAIIGYVDVDGHQVVLDGAPPTFEFAALEQAYEGRGGTIMSSDGTTWTLAVEAAPDRATPYAGYSPPSPAADGRGVYVTSIGPNGDPSIDFGIATQWVVAELHPGGTATWWSVPEGWDVAASDVWGTVLVRQDGTQLDIALAEFPSVPPCANPPAFTPTVLPDGFGTDLVPGEGAQITIGPDGEAEPIEPVNPDVHHYAGEPGMFIDIVPGAQPGYAGTDAEPIEVLGVTGTIAEIEDGYVAEFTLQCGTYTLIASGITRDEFAAFLTGLELG